MVTKGEKSFSELHEIAVRVAKNIHHCNDSEHGRSIDKYGAVRKFTGDFNGVYIDIIKDTRITVHNHPHKYKIPNTFSDEDIYRLLTKKHLCEIIVCSYGYYFTLRRGSYAGLSMDIRNQVKEMYQEIKIRVIKEWAMNPENSNKYLKTAEREVNSRLEKEYQKELTAYLTSKGLCYEKVKI